MNKIVFPLALLALISIGGGETATMNEIHFCHFDVPATVKTMNANFSITYTLVIDSRGIPTQVTKLRDEYLREEIVASCLEAWRLPNIQPGSELVLTSTWRHGIGWTRMSIIGGGLRQTIIRSGDLHPYSPPQQAKREP